LDKYISHYVVIHCGHVLPPKYEFFIIVFPYKQWLIPVEVKSGKNGRLRSLHEYMGKASHTLAVRIYGGSLVIDPFKTIAGKPFYLLNLPFYLTAKLPQYMEWFERHINKE